MPQPTRSDIHVNRPLTNISVAFTQGMSQFIAGRVFPAVPVPKQSDKYFKYSRRDWLRSQMEVRPLSSESAGSGFDISSAETYFAEVYALHKDIDDRLRTNQDDPINLDRDSTMWLTEQELLFRDIKWAQRYFTTSVWTGNTDQTGVAAAPGANQFLQWNDAASTPIQDIKRQARFIQSRTAKRPNRLVLAPKVWDALADHPTVVDRVKHTQLGVLTTELFAQLVEVEQVLVATGVVDTAKENNDETVAAALVNFVLTNGALLVYAAPAPSLMMPSGGYTFNWSGLYGAGSNGRRILTMRSPLRNSDRVEIETAFDHKIVAPEVGVFFATAVA